MNITDRRSGAVKEFNPYLDNTLDVIRFALYIFLMIKTFRCKDSRRLYEERISCNRFRNFDEAAYRKLFQLAHAKELRDLQAPGNRLEKLGGDRKGQYSIRINDQWRICFAWNEGAYDVEIIDYH